MFCVDPFLDLEPRLKPWLWNFAIVNSMKRVVVKPASYEKNQWYFCNYYVHSNKGWKPFESYSHCKPLYPVAVLLKQLEAKARWEGTTVNVLV